MGRFFIAMSRNLLVRVGAAAVVVLVGLGIVTGALPVACFASGSISCTANETGTGAIVPAPVTVVATKTAAPVVIADAPVAETEVATVSEDAPPRLTQNELVAATFALLPPELLAPSATRPAAGTTPSSRTPAVRVVKTTPIRVQPLQVPQTPAAVAAASVAASSEPATNVSPSLSIAYANELAPVTKPAAAASSEVVAEAETSAPTPPAKPAAATDGKQMTITGKGANVRSSPSKGKSSVLFALAGGASVTVGDNLHGWLHITDGRGRSGWVYKDYLQ